jgi:hypothetical protein
MSKKISYLVLTTMILSLAFLSGCVEQDNKLKTSDGGFPENNFTQEQFVARLESKPDDVSDHDLAWFLSLGSRPYGDNKKPGVIMWQGPIRVSAEDGQGNDLDLSVYPGNVVQQYVAMAALYTKLPITITKAQNRDNNMSIVISEKRVEGDVGRIYGVPELSDRQHEKINGLLAPAYVYALKDLVGPEEVGEASLFLGFTSKACAANIVIPKNSGDQSIYIFWQVHNVLRFCLDSIGTTFWGEAGQPRVKSESLTHSLYYWKIFYNSGLTPGMDQVSAERKLTDYLNRQQP